MGNNDDEFAKTTYFDWRSHVSGMSVWEILQETTRTANSLDKSVMWKSISKAHIYLVRRGSSGQQASGLLAPVCSRSEGRSANDHYPFKSRDLNQHMQVMSS